MTSTDDSVAHRHSFFAGIGPPTTASCERRNRRPVVDTPSSTPPHVATRSTTRRRSSRQHVADCSRVPESAHGRRSGVPRPPPAEGTIPRPFNRVRARGNRDSELTRPRKWSRPRFDRCFHLSRSRREPSHLPSASADASTAGLDPPPSDAQFGIEPNLPDDDRRRRRRVISVTGTTMGG